MVFKTKIFFRPWELYEYDKDNQTYTNILRLEDEIGDATEYDSFLQDMFFKHKFLFNGVHADIVRKKQQKWDEFYSKFLGAELIFAEFFYRNLNEFIDSKLEILM